MYLILRFFENEKMENRVYNRKENDFIKKFPNMASINVNDIKRAFGIYIGEKCKDIKVKELSILKIDIKDNEINILFNIVKDLEYTSKKFDSALYGLLVRRNYIIKNEFIPYAVLLKDEEMDNLINSINNLNTQKYLEDEEIIAKLIVDNNWEEIYKFYGQVEEISNNYPEIWNDCTILGEIGFAASKLSALSIIPKGCKNDKEKKKNLLSEKKKYRDDAEKLYKRCVELEPQNPSVYSNLGYLYYNNVIELTAPGGRRDEDVWEEFKKAEENIKKALEIDDTRIRDLYRLGYLYSEKMYELKLYSNKDKEERSAEDFIKEGIKYFDRVIELWEKLDDEDKEYSKKKNFKKDYIKALFDRGKAYQQLYSSYWNKVFYSRILFNKSFDNIQAFSNRECENDIFMAKKSFEKCWNSECKGNDEIENEDYNYINSNLKDWSIEAVDILYRLGYIYFDIYWYIKSLKPNAYEDKCSMYSNKSEKCFKLCDKVNWNERGSQSKKFVHEKLARLYISTGRYDKAVDLLKNYSNSKDYYILNTLCFAYYLKEDYKTCIKILKNICDDKYNLCINQSRILLAMSYYRSKNYIEAKNIFEKLNSVYKKKSILKVRLSELIKNCGIKQEGV